MLSLSAQAQAELPQHLKTPIAESAIAPHSSRAGWLRLLPLRQRRMRQQTTSGTRTAEGAEQISLWGAWELRLQSASTYLLCWSEWKQALKSHSLQKRARQ